MNEIGQLFTDMSDAELLEAIAEIKDCEQTGIMKPEGVVRKYAQLSSDIMETVPSMTLHLAVTNIYREGAMRWSNEHSK